MIVEYIYWQRTNGTDGALINSLANRSDINMLADKGEIKYFFVFPVLYEKKDKSSPNFPLALGRYYTKTRDGKKRIVVPKEKEAGEFIATDKGYKELKAEHLARFDRQYFAGMLDQYNRNISEIARVAKLNRKSVYRIMRELGIDL